MNNLEIFCTSIQYLKILDKLPKYIKPLGLGESLFPDHWLDEKKGEFWVEEKIQMYSGIF